MSTGRTAVLGWSVAVLLVAGAAGFGLAELASPFVHNRYFPWIIGRGLGLAAYTAMTVLCLLGMWLRHPWRLRWPVLHPETAVRLHASIAAATLVLLAGHLTALALDPYAGVGWIGVLLPGSATYRPVAVGVGVVALWVLLAIVATARLGSRLVGRRWLALHHLSLPLFAAVFCHGVLAGSDTVALRGAYAATGAIVIAMFVSRRLARPIAALGGEPRAWADR